MASTTRDLPIILRLIHWTLIVNFITGLGYAAWMVFFVVRPEGISGPLSAAAKSIPFEMMMTRRLYAMEFWVAVSGLAIYLALTEILPRQLSRMRS
ncbi:MAG: hypothetical protein KC502_14500 [Myxococcales bacterium]|nr:hypothetical protein [Myxococcales bacterium]